MKAAVFLVLSLALALAGAARAAEPAAQTTAPAALGAEAAQNAGQLGAEKPVLPQISIPLKRQATPATGIVPAPGADLGVDDRAARCLAKETRAERAACEATLPGSRSGRAGTKTTGSPKPPAASR